MQRQREKIARHLFLCEPIARCIGLCHSDRAVMDRCRRYHMHHNGNMSIGDHLALLQVLSSSPHHQISWSWQSSTSRWGSGGSNPTPASAVVIERPEVYGIAQHRQRIASTGKGGTDKEVAL